MKGIHSFNPQHADIIHDIAYDYYGQRLATCSSDQTIKVWDQVPNSPSNNVNSNSPSKEPFSWKLSSSWKAHNGSIYKLDWAHPEFGNILASCSVDKTVLIWEEIEEKGQKTWTRRFHFADFRDSVVDLAFAPKHLGLRVATASSDGWIRIYECPDVTLLTQWVGSDEFESQKGGVNCLSWNYSSVESRALMVVGSAENAKIWEYLEAQRKWQVVDYLTGYPKGITSISWAPNMGRSYHLIATASKDKTVRIWKFVIPLVKTDKYELTQLASFSDHNSEVWRVRWNITGTVLASSGDDGSVRLWKANSQGEWGPFSKISGENE